MNFNEWIKGKPSLFNEINKIKPFPFIDTYGSENIDLLYKTKYGTRSIPTSIENLTVPELAKLLVTSFGDSWSNKYTLLKDELLLGVDSKTVVDEMVTDDTTRTTNSNQTNKVSAFNDDDLTTNDSSDDVVNDDIQKERSKSVVTTNTNMNAIKSQLELMDSNFIVDTVLKDVSTLVSLSIY